MRLAASGPCVGAMTCMPPANGTACKSPAVLAVAAPISHVAPSTSTAVAAMFSVSSMASPAPAWSSVGLASIGSFCVGAFAVGALSLAPFDSVGGGGSLVCECRACVEVAVAVAASFLRRHRAPPVLSSAVGWLTRMPRHASPPASQVTGWRANPTRVAPERRARHGRQAFAPGSRQKPGQKAAQMHGCRQPWPHAQHPRAGANLLGRRPALRRLPSGRGCVNRVFEEGCDDVDKGIFRWSR